jgi:nucleoid-associated protein YgaU
MMVRARLTVLGVGELALAFALWRRGHVDDPLRWSDPVGWLRATTPENALVEVGRVLVLALVAWMVLATVLALAARSVDLLLGTTACIAAVSHVVPRFIVVMVVAAVATSAPVLAQARTPMPPLGPVRDGRAPTALVAPATTAPAPATAPVPPPVTAPVAASRPTPAAPVPAPTAASRPTPAAPRTHVVVAGESLWSIARDRVGVGADPDTVIAYWRALCDANRATLPSGDVNVIHPGETVVLPS